jgi:hypothetical protein
MHEKRFHDGNVARNRASSSFACNSSSLASWAARAWLESGMAAFARDSSALSDLTSGLRL